MPRGGRGRHTAKTGDKGIYKSREKEQSNNTGDEVLEDEEFLSLEPKENESSSSSDEEEAIMDLGGGGGDSSSSDDSSSDNEEEESEEGGFEEPTGPVNSSSDEDSDDDEEEVPDVRDWGKKKSNYYEGDTADLEIGQDEEDAVDEEEAAKELVQSRLKDMDEDDFVLSGDEDEDQKEEVETYTTRDISKLSHREKSKLLEKRFPELLPLLSHFSGTVEELENSTNIATNALFEAEEDTPEQVGATELGQEYLLTKAMLQSSATLNLAVYLLLLSEMEENSTSSMIQSHPVMARLHKFHTLKEKLSSAVDGTGVEKQIGQLVQATALVADEEDDNHDDVHAVKEVQDVREDVPESEEINPIKGSSIDPVDASEEEHSSDEAEAEHDRVIHEARFGLRAKEVGAGDAGGRKRIRRQVDFGDEDGDNGAAASRALASTLNTIEQRAATRKRRPVHSEMLDEPDLDNSELRKGLDMMEEELGRDDESDRETRSGDGQNDDLSQASDDDYYSQVKKRSKSKKAKKASKYAVAPKLPRLDTEVQGERAISRTIMKNRGLVAHKNKLNRNPRVKKREQYRKRQIQRKGAVREVRTDEGHKYAGEGTGIKTGLSRSRNLRG